jgi:hypothetical protein
MIAVAEQNFQGANQRSRRVAFTPIKFPIQRPFLSVYACCAIADLTYDQVLSLIDDGAIPVAFNIAQRQSTTKLCLRVLTSSLAEYLSGRRAAAPGPNFATELASLFPALSATVRTPTLARILDCNEDHIARLVHDGCLRSATTLRRGAGGCGLIYRHSIIDFLLQRRIR